MKFGSEAKYFDTMYLSRVSGTKVNLEVALWRRRRPRRLRVLTKFLTRVSDLTSTTTGTNTSILPLSLLNYGKMLVISHFTRRDA